MRDSYRDDFDEYVPLDVAALRLGLPVATVLQLVEKRVLRARNEGWGLEVQPAIIPGHTA